GVEIESDFDSDCFDIAFSVVNVSFGGIELCFTVIDWITVDCAMDETVVKDRVDDGDSAKEMKTEAYCRRRTTCRNSSIVVRRLVSIDRKPSDCAPDFVEKGDKLSFRSNI
uniref:Uncharacterized protein n=1 Tax=Romanomermis culicivorax TaxID=13658 RepID=A0A915IER3_ROMCU